MTPFAGLVLLSGSVLMNAEVGVSSRVFRDSWMPVTVEIRNDAADIAPELRISVHSPRGSPVAYRRRLSLVPPCRKRFQWNVFLTGMETEIVVALIGENEEILQSRILPLTYAEDVPRNVLVVGRPSVSLRTAQIRLRTQPRVPVVRGKKGKRGGRRPKSPLLPQEKPPPPIHFERRRPRIETGREISRRSAASGWRWAICSSSARSATTAMREGAGGNTVRLRSPFGYAASRRFLWCGPRGFVPVRHG